MIFVFMKFDLFFLYNIFFVRLRNLCYTEDVLELILYFNKMTIIDCQKNKTPQSVNRLINLYLTSALAVFQLYDIVLNQQIQYNI